MKKIRTEFALCPCCMEEHEIQTVLSGEETVFKDRKITYEAVYRYCDKADELYMTQDMIRANDIAMKNAYRQDLGLLTSDEIKAIRMQYHISQSDLCILLGWGEKTIARYESHQVQDRAHDSILRKLSEDPQWYMELLSEVGPSFTEEAYKRYRRYAAAIYENSRDSYYRKAIGAQYAGIEDNPEYHGNTGLSIDKTIDLICYYASSPEVTSLYKVKLMKLLWYADALSYKNNGHSITGLVYQAMPMGAVPIAHNAIINLKDIPCEEVEIGEETAYFFHMNETYDPKFLTEDEIMAADFVIRRLGRMSRKELVAFMHKEQAYIQTPYKGLISFKYARELQI